jgi:fibronectin-binding autotransporter adhesin
LAIAWAPSLHGQTVVWRNSGSANLNLGSNWVGGAVPNSTQIASFTSASFSPTSLQLNSQSISVLGIRLEAGSGPLTFSSPGFGGAKTISIGSAGIVNASSSLLTVDISSKINIALTANSSLTAYGELWITDSTSSTSGFDIGAFTLTLNGTFGSNFSEDGQRSGIAKAFIGSGNIIKAGTSTFELTGANLYTGTTTLSGGKLSVGILANGGEWSGIGKSSAAASNLVFDGGTLLYTGPATSTDRLFTLTGNGGTIEAGANARPSSGALTLSANGSIVFSGSNTSPILTLSGSSSASNTFAPALGDNGTGHTSLAKTGTGTWILSGTNTFTGGLFVHAGTLGVASSGSIAGANTLIIDGGTLKLDNAAQSIALLSISSGAIEGLSAVKLQGVGSTWTGGQFAGTGTLTVDSSATLTISGAGEHNYNARPLINRGTTTWSAGNLRSSSGGSFTNYGTLNDSASANHAHVGSGSFTNASGGTYNKTGVGTTTFDVPFTNSGTLVFGGGSLIFNGGFTNAGGSFGGTGGSVQSTTPINFAANSTLGGNSTITAPSVTTSGNVIPGNSAGLITVNGDLTLLAGSKLIIELGGTQQGVTYDALVVSGTVVLGAELKLSFFNNYQSSVLPTDTFTIVQAGGNVSGAFSNVPSGGRIATTDNFGSFKVNYGVSSDYGSNLVVLSNFVAVPEPSTWQLIGAGAVLALLARRYVRGRGRRQD